MFFPYLRGRQYELLALQELARKKLISKSVIPVVEPLKKNTTFNNTLKVYSQAKLPIALIFNPAVGDLAGVNFTSLLPSVPNCVIPSVIQNENADNVIKSLERIGKSKKNILVVLNNHDYLDDYVNEFSVEPPLYTLIPKERSIQRAVVSDKVIFEDKFNKQSKNADYANNTDEFFSDDHLYFSDEGYSGFGDYSIVGERFEKGGFTPQAVAIHIVYFDEEMNLRIHHFVSDSVIGTEDTGGKFYEAVTKLARWFEELGDARQETVAMTALLEYAKNGKFPALGTIKKLSIMHHLELVSKFLDGKI